MTTTKEISELELMDWKEIETTAESEIRNCKKSIAIAQILLGNAVIRIKQLKGKTNEELNAEVKASTT